MKKTVAALCAASFFMFTPAQAQIPMPEFHMPQIPGNPFQMPAPEVPTIAPAPVVQPFSPSVQARLDAKTAEVIAKYDGLASIAIDDGRHLYFSGNVNQGPVMSTIKVPVALATERIGVQNVDNTAAALQWSDNGATDNMWYALGGGTEAAAHVQRQISYGTESPDMSYVEYWTWPNWSITGQAQYARTLECQDPDYSVIGNMTKVVDEQSYGLGNISNARFKGGWSPLDDGRYFVRQMGFIPTSQGMIGVGMAAQPADGMYGSAQDMLNELTSAVQETINMGIGSPLTCAGTP